MSETSSTGREQEAEPVTVSMWIDAQGRSDAFLVKGLSAVERASDSPDRLDVSFSIRFESDSLIDDRQAMLKGIKAIARAASFGSKPEISAFEIQMGSTLVGFALSFSGSGLVAFLHQYKNIREGTVTLANDIRKAMEYFGWLDARKEPSDNRGRNRTRVRIVQRDFEKPIKPQKDIVEVLPRAPRKKRMLSLD